MKFTWIGGPTFILELGAFRLVSDPVFSDTLDVVGADARRLTPLGDVFIPHDIDCLMVSQVSADHFDPRSGERFTDGVFVVAPAMKTGDVARAGYTNVQGLEHHDSVNLVRDNETLDIVAVTGNPQDPTTNGYMLWHHAGGKTTTAYWTGDTLYNNDLVTMQKRYGYVDMLIIHLGAEGGSRHAQSLNGKEAMQFVYRMRPNLIVPVHHSTFSHYTEPVDDFKDRIDKTIYDKKLVILAEGESFTSDKY